MPNQKNLDTVQNLREKIQKSKSITFVDYLGLDVNNINDFRAKVREQDGESVIARNTLIKLALKEEGIETKEMEEHLKGPTAAIFSYDDPVAYLKTIYEFAKEFELPKVKFAYIEGVFTEAAQTKTISELPSKEELIATIVGRMNSPISGIVNVLGGPRRNLVTVLARVAEEKQ